jgi:hypothetical protein
MEENKTEYKSIKSFNYKIPILIHRYFIIIKASEE